MSTVFRSFRELKESGQLSMTGNANCARLQDTVPRVSENEQIEVGLICWLPSEKSFPAKFGDIIKIKAGDNLRAKLHLAVDSLADMLELVATSGKDYDGIPHGTSRKIKEIILCQKEISQQLNKESL